MDEIYLTKWGNSNRRVVLVHGSAQGSEVGGDKHFAKQIDLAEHGWELVVPDRPGHGRTAAPGRPDDAALDGAWVAELLGDGAHLVGHSFGGAVALAAAARRPGAVRSLTLIEPALQKFALADPDVRKFGLKAMLTLALPMTAAMRARRFALLVRIPEEIRGGSSPAELRQMGRGLKALRLPSGGEIAAQLAVARTRDIPFMVVTGGWSRALDAIGRLAAKAGGGQHVVIASTHHFPQAVSDEFNDRLNNFMLEADAKALQRPERESG